MNLNAPQQEAVDHFRGPCLCLAGPGSGKTAVLTQRILKLIEKDVEQNKILVITFTKAAAMEMKERFNKLSGGNSSVNFGTFHSLFYGLLSRELKLDNSALLSGTTKLQLLKEAAFDSKIKDVDADYIDMLAREIGYIKNTCAAIDSYESSICSTNELRDVYKNYERLKDKYGQIDFDDMLTKSLQLIKEKSYVLEKWRNMFEFILVDEAQDMNPIQYELIKLLSEGHRNLFLVGDDDQSIYGFRGANPGLLMDFAKDFPEAKQILLNFNYRCPENIVKSSVNLINNNKNRFLKDINPTRENGSIRTIYPMDEYEEAKMIVGDIRRKMENHEDLHEIAVLYRNHSNANALLGELINNHIPFYLKDKMPNIYNSPLILDMEAYLKLINGDMSRKNMLRIINKPERYIGRQTMEQSIVSFQDMRSFYGQKEWILKRIDSLESDINLMKKMKPFAALMYVRKIIGYDQFIRKAAVAEGKNDEEYMAVLDGLLNEIKDCKTIKQAVAYIQNMRDVINTKNKNLSSDNQNQIGLYTLHGSKGLEFNTVYIINVNEGVIPSKNAKDEPSVEEERRMFYVGITRSKKDLILSIRKQKNREKLYSSRFISEMSL